MSFQGMKWAIRNYFGLSIVVIAEKRKRVDGIFTVNFDFVTFSGTLDISLYATGALGNYCRLCLLTSYLNRFSQD